MAREKRKVALVIDNCPSHPKSLAKGLTAVELVFLPPNTTSKTQPMDQGVIYSLKEKFKKQVATKKIVAMEKKQPFKISVLDAMQMMRQAWSLVTQKTISNCFRHANFIVEESEPPVEEESDDPEDDLPLAQLARQPTFDMEEFLRLDLNLPTCEDVNEDSIVRDIVTSRQQGDDNKQQEDHDDSEDETTTSPPPSIADGIANLDNVIRVFQTLDNCDDIIARMYSAQRRLYKEELMKKFQTRKQSDMTDFFKRRIV